VSARSRAGRCALKPVPPACPMLGPRVIGSRGPAQIFGRIYGIRYDLRTPVARRFAFLKEPTAIRPNVAGWQRFNHGRNQVNEPRN
jgi:hypothetical protein